MSRVELGRQLSLLLGVNPLPELGALCPKPGPLGPLGGGDPPTLVAILTPL